MINSISIIIVAVALLALCGLMYLVLDTLRFLEAVVADEVDIKVILNRLTTMRHDLQQIKTRLTWSKKREKKDLKQEVLKLSHSRRVK